MTILLEMTLMGIVATLLMDLLAIPLARLKVIHPLVKPEAIGRWTLYIFRGKFFHKDINKTPTLNHEKTAALLSHYLIGIALAGIYLYMESAIPAMQNDPWAALIFGLATVVLPWFWLYPSMGLGFLASKAPKISAYIVTSLVNHTDFGLGLMIWVFLFRPFLV